MTFPDLLADGRESAVELVGVDADFFPLQVNMVKVVYCPVL